MLDNPTWEHRLPASQLVAGSHYYLRISIGTELRYADPRPDAVRVDVIEIAGELIEEARTANAIGRNGPIPSPPLGNGWRIYDASSPSWTAFRRVPPWQRRPRRGIEQ
jgi:hypothetical protein